ncbi:MAG: hypothetical protein C0404_06485 [Verrucomicrobia bacterium]|nr:hypothetical protein [Verrucomicrobiota bacterium]
MAELKTKPTVALQLWSVNQVIPKDVRGTLKKIAGMGYKGIECAGYYGLSGKDIRGMLDEFGMVCVGSHVGLDLLEGDKFEQTVATNKALGTDRLIVPGADLSNMPKLIERLNAAHVKAKAAGMRVGFHNHTKEFELVDGKTKFDMIFSQTPADFLMQVDIGWAYHAAQDVPALLRKYAKRLETVHVKEFSKEKKCVVVGAGDIKWPPLFELMEKETAIKTYVIEQEQFTVGPMESVKECFDNMRKMGQV